MIRNGERVAYVRLSITKDQVDLVVHGNDENKMTRMTKRQAAEELRRLADVLDDSGRVQFDEVREANRDHARAHMTTRADKTRK